VKAARRRSAGGVGAFTPRRRPPIRLRPLLGTLALGTLALPFAFALFAAIVLPGGVDRASIGRFSMAARELRRALEVGDAGEISVRRNFHAPAWLELVATDEAGVVVFSTFPDLEIGRIADQDVVSSIAARSASGSSFYSDRIEQGGRSVGGWFAIVHPRDFRYEVEIWRPLFGSALLAFLALMAFAAGVVVAAQLGSAVEGLKRAAERIASGDLDTAVMVGGVREIVDLAEAMDGMREALREDLARRSRFLASVSHDLRTPLTAIGGYIEAVEDGLASDPETLRRYLAIMRDKTSLLEDRIAELIGFVRMETGEWRVNFQELELRPFLDGLVREYREDALLLGRVLDVEIEAAAGLRVAADQNLLRRALENLLSNAIRYGPPGSAIGMEAVRAESGLSLAIDDEGPGLWPEERERVFEPFYRASGAREGEGLGLGLYIARSIIRGHGWDIRAESSPKGGARFTVTIPQRALSGPAGVDAPRPPA
jgi:signal transduction histidine kinase